ncbi:MAG: GntR family transcriptional regulator, partial [Desulfovibrio sp.]
MLNRKSPVPLYHQLAEILLAAIRTSTYAEGERIPSEHALAQQYSIGRPTVRQAIDSLVRKGVLIRKRGSGTFVAHKRESVDLFSLAGTMASFTKTGLSPEVELLQRPSRIVLDGDDVNPFSRSAALFLSRLSRVDATPVLVEDIYMDPAVFAAIETM